MAEPIELAGDVMSGGTALAGLILVYLGSVATGFSSYTKPQQDSVRAAYQMRAWFAFIGVACAIAAAAAAAIAKWMQWPSLATLALVLLLVSFAWGVASALVTALEVR